MDDCFNTDLSDTCHFVKVGGAGHATLSYAYVCKPHEKFFFFCMGNLEVWLVHASKAGGKHDESEGRRQLNSFDCSDNKHSEVKNSN